PPPVANGVISGSVINDANGNGVADPGEVGIPGVLVTLAPVGGPAHAAAQTRGAASGARQRDASRVDAAINDLNAGLSGGSATTDGAGTFSFTGLVAGTYSLGYTPASGFVDTATVQHTIVLTAGQILNGQTFLAQQRNASIGGAVVNDANGNGVLDAAEKGLPGAVVSLAKGPVPVGTATTDASGAYLFTVLPAGNYTLSDRLPPGFVTTGLQPAPMALLAGGTLTGQNLFAQQRTASISGGVVSKDTKAGIPGVA